MCTKIFNDFVVFISDQRLPSVSSNRYIACVCIKIQYISIKSICALPPCTPLQSIAISVYDTFLYHFCVVCRFALSLYHKIKVAGLFDSAYILEILCNVFPFSCMLRLKIKTCEKCEEKVDKRSV